MKKVGYIIITIILMMIAVRVEAATNVTYESSGGKLKKGDIVEVKLNIDTDEHVRVVVFDYAYDHDKLEINDIRSDVSPVTWRNGEEISGSASMDAVDAKTGAFNVATLKFKVLEDFASSETSTVVISGFRITDGVLVTNLDSYSITIKKTAEEEPVVVPIKNEEEEKKEEEKQEEKKGEIKPIDTGVTLPVLSVSLLGGSILIFKKNKGMLFRI